MFPDPDETADRDATRPRVRDEICPPRVYTCPTRVPGERDRVTSVCRRTRPRARRCLYADTRRAAAAVVSGAACCFTFRPARDPAASDETPTRNRSRKTSKGFSRGRENKTLSRTSRDPSGNAVSTTRFAIIVLRVMTPLPDCTRRILHTA